MALYNLARVHSATLGVADVVLGAAVSGFLTFPLAGVPHGATVSYGIMEAVAGVVIQSEVGRGVWNAGTLTLARTVVLDSTNGGAKIVLTGIAEVFITAVAEDFDHTLLVNLNSVGYYHLTQADYADLTDAGDSLLHYHASDRNSANFTGADWIDLTDGGVTNLHAHALDHAAVTLDANADTLLSLVGQLLGLDVQTANRIFSGPTTGAAAVPTFRALVDADMPASVTAKVALVVNTRAVILASVPTVATIGISNDNLAEPEFYFHDLVAWKRIAIPLGLPSLTVDMGALPYNDDNGYGVADIANKDFHNVALKGYDTDIRTVQEGALRKIALSSTTNAVQAYINAAWRTLLAYSAAQEDAIMLWTDDWDGYDTLGKNIIHGHKTDMGPLQSDHILFGGNIGDQTP